jgi:hypothetical protein
VRGIMPFKSKAQMRLMFAKEKDGEIKKGTVKSWAKKTNIKALPDKIKLRKMYGKNK